MDTPANTQPTSKTLANTRSYVVLQSHDGKHTWTAVATVTAASAAAAAAIHAVDAATHDDVDGTPRHYVAVPARNWRPITATLSTRVSVRLDAAGATACTRSG